MKTKQKYWLEPSQDCRNCGDLMPEQANYCPSCSQRNTTGKINVFEFLKEALSNLFNIDTKFFRTLFGFVFPGRLTNEFFKGKHQSFASPIRLFFVTILSFIAVCSWIIPDYVMESDFMEIEDDKQKVVYLDYFKEVKEELDLEAKNEDARAGIDSLYKKIQDKLRVDTVGENFNGEMFGDSIYITKADMLKMTPEEIIEKNQIKGFFNQQLIRQLIRFNKEPQTFVASLLGKMTLMFLFIIPCMALLFKFLYIRGNYFYVEHLVFLFHFHAFAFLIGTMTIGLQKYLTPMIYALVSGVLMIYLLLSMKNVYQQGWGKTMLKFFVIQFAYLTLFSICVTIVMLLNFLLF